LWWGNCGLVLCFGDQYKPEQVSGQGHQKVSGKEGENGLLILNIFGQPWYPLSKASTIMDS
jgi:hypothetical protein